MVETAKHKKLHDFCPYLRYYQLSMPTASSMAIFSLVQPFLHTLPKSLIISLCNKDAKAFFPGGKIHPTWILHRYLLSNTKAFLIFLPRLKKAIYQTSWGLHNSIALLIRWFSVWKWKLYSSLACKKSQSIFSVV